MLDKLFSPEVMEETLWILQNEIPLAVWETIYVTVLATAFAIVLGLPLGVRVLGLNACATTFASCTIFFYLYVIII